tara:strand:- start:820 stop:1224 length:405 start_codon:yes stop_codon:yes gene_type:complete
MLKNIRKTYATFRIFRQINYNETIETIFKIDEGDIKGHMVLDGLNHIKNNYGLEMSLPKCRTCLHPFNKFCPMCLMIVNDEIVSTCKTRFTKDNFIHQLPQDQPQSAFLYPPRVDNSSVYYPEYMDEELERMAA